MSDLSIASQSTQWVRSNFDGRQGGQGFGNLRFMGKTKWEEKTWESARIIFEPTDEELTASAGLGPLIDVFMQSPQYAELGECLPRRESNASFDTRHFALTYMAGFWYGHDCLDDFCEFKEDPSVEDKLGGLPSVRAMGDYLRDFSQDNLDAMNAFLSKQALSARKVIKPGEVVTLDIDSTSHVQSGEKMEGLAYNYKNEWCLDSLVTFDELGLCYGMELRPGNTYSSEGGAVMIDPVLAQLPKPADLTQKHKVRADSAFCREDFIRAVMNKGALFTITAHDNMNWTEETKRITKWEPWVYTQEELEAAAKRKRDLPKVELSHYLYEPGWAESLRFPVIIKRTWIESEQGSLLDTGFWKYYAVMTNFSLYWHTMQQVMEFHAKRGNGENFIREEKYGYDLKHFPCQKLMANHAYGLLALIAHNFLRTIAIIDKPDKPNYSKKLRRKFVFIPGRLVKHARQLVMKVPKRFWSAFVDLYHFGRKVNDVNPVWMRPKQASLCTVT